MLALVVGYLVNANRADRVDYRAALAEVRRELDDAEDDRDELHTRLDEERERRRRAEDEATRAIRAMEAAADEIGQLRRTVAELEAEVKRLRQLLARNGLTAADGG